MLLRAAFWRAFLRQRGLAPYLDELDRHGELDPAAARDDLGRRLLAQLKYFATRADALPEWLAAAKLEDIDALWDVWPTLPVVTKADLQTRFEAKNLKHRLGLAGVISSTGGSTGEPTSYLHDRDMLSWTCAGRYFARRQFGWQPGQATICVWGSERDIGRQRTLRNRCTAWLRNEWLVDGYQLNEATVDGVLQHLTRHRRTALYGFTSMLEFVAQRVLERGVVLPGQVTAAWTGGETLSDRQADRFFRAFGTPLQDFYGGRELGPIAYQQHNHRSLRVLRPFVFAEVVDEKNRPAAPGSTGRLLLTSTVCRGTPFLRYDIGDLACCDPQDQDACGVRAISRLQGRTGEVLKLPTGRTVHSMFWNHLFKEIGEVQQFQVVLRDERSLLLRLRGTPWPEERDRMVRGVVAGLVGDMPLEIRWVDQIPRTAQGKLLQTVRES